MSRFWILALVALAWASCGGNSGDTTALKTQVASLQMQMAQPTAEPADRVVGIEFHCRAPGGYESFGSECASRSAYPGIVKTQQLTVRTSSGTTFKLEVSPDTKVAVGDVWPPK